MQTDEVQLYGWEDAAAKLCVRPSWLRDKVKQRAIPHRRLGRLVRFSPEDLREIAEAGRTPAERAVKQAQRELGSQPVVSIPTPLPKRQRMSRP